MVLNLTMHGLLARAGCLRYHGTKCQLLYALFSLLSSLSLLSAGLLFSQKALSKGSKILHWVFSIFLTPPPRHMHQKISASVHERMV